MRFREAGQIMADLFQLSARDGTGCVPDVSVLMLSTRAAQPMRTEEDFVRAGRLKKTLVRVNRVSSSSVQLTSRGRKQDAEGVRFTQPLMGTPLDAKELRHQEDPQ